MTNIFQKNGKASSSVAASLIQRLPKEDDPQRSREERENVVFIAYGGTCLVYTPNLRRPTNIFSAPAGIASAGSDTVRERNENIILLIVVSSVKTLFLGMTLS